MKLYPAHEAWLGPLKNHEVADVFYEIADLLEMAGTAGPFEPIAYRRAARQIEALAEDVEDVARQGRLRTIGGIGPSIARAIEEYLSTGKLTKLDELRTQVPPGLIEVMSIPGLGPKRAALLWRELRITNLDELREAVENGRLRRLKGFGEKSEDNIRRGLEVVAETAKRFLIARAYPIAMGVIAYLRANAAVDRIEAGGSLRRWRETVGDVDLVVVTTKPEEVSRTFTTMPMVKSVLAAGERKASVVLREGLQVDLRMVEARNWGAALQYFTGNKDHNIRLRGTAQARGMKLNEYGLFREDESIAGAEEEDVYRALDLAWIPPELREDAGEVDAAAKGELPDLVRLDEIRGDFHVHTNLTDGVDTLGSMIDAARSKGYEYVGISDHSQSLAVARGLSAEQVLAHRDRIRRLNAELRGFTVLAGTECDILMDGAMDYSDEVLKELDFVIASVHSRFNLPEPEMTGRIIRAVEHPDVNILSHPLTRLIGSRDAIAFDKDRVFEAAAEAGTAIEVNAFPNRMDLPGPMARYAKEKGCKLAIDTDSHARGQLDHMVFGVGLARRGWLEAGDVVNAWPLEKVKAFFG